MFSINNKVFYATMMLQGAKKDFRMERFPNIYVPGVKEIIQPTSVCET